MTGLLITLVVLQSLSLMLQLARYNVASETLLLLRRGAQRAWSGNDNA